jgi:biotin transporter BioY
VLPFLPGDAAKIVAATLIADQVRKAVRLQTV